MIKNVTQFLPFKSKTFSPVESLGYGGLGIGWGLQCWEFSDDELLKTGLDVKKMRTAYDIVSKRIGISATNDDAAKYTLGALSNYQPSADMDQNHEKIYEKYLRKKINFNKNGFFLGRTPLALITKNIEDRNKYPYRDMDFYDDNSYSAWRPWMTVDKLKKFSNFKYTGGILITHFTEDKQSITVFGFRMSDKKKVIYQTKNLILASGAIGSARIALRSQVKKTVTKIPILCNPYTYIPCLQPAMLGKGSERRKLGFGQLSFFYDKANHDLNLSVASMYSYQSLMLFRIVRQIPFNFKDSRKIMQRLMPALVILGVHHPDERTEHKYLELRKDSSSPTGDYLYGHYSLSQKQRRHQKTNERKYISAMRKLGVYALTKINPGYGSSIHYAGTLPFSKSAEPLTLSAKGKLSGTNSVYVCDSSGFNYLPARGLTFSLLANAHITAENILNENKEK